MDVGEALEHRKPCLWPLVTSRGGKKEKKEPVSSVPPFHPPGVVGKEGSLSLGHTVHDLAQISI